MGPVAFVGDGGAFADVQWEIHACDSLVPPGRHANACLMLLKMTRFQCHLPALMLAHKSAPLWECVGKKKKQSWNIVFFSSCPLTDYCTDATWCSVFLFLLRWLNRGKTSRDLDFWVLLRSTITSQPTEGAPQSTVAPPWPLNRRLAHTPSHTRSL